MTGIVKTDQIQGAQSSTITIPGSNNLVIGGNLTVDTSTLYVDSTNNRVGIGTSSPIGELNIDGRIVVDDGARSNPTGGASLVIDYQTTSDIQGRIRSRDWDGSTWKNLTVEANNFIIKNDVELMRIDSNGNLLVGTTDINPYDNTSGTGIALRSSGAIYNAIDGGTPLVLNRMTNDGTIAQFRQGGTIVGSIGTKSGSLLIGSTDTYLRINDPSDTIFPSDSAGLERDNTINLGKSSSRFKDLYLSGGVYLGGTGSANYLDDYEKGSWTPTYEGGTGNPTVTYGTRTGYYVKVGNLVYINFDIDASAISGGSGTLRIGGLPFNVNGSTNHYPTVYFRLYSAVTLSSNHYLTAYMQTGHISLQETQLDNGDHTGLTSFDSSGRIAGTAMYYSV